ncbi:MULTISPECIES: adenylate/guanylate cyclase domain-containing protein [unclassified Mycolicibacterium]|uniref:adenylate/guanylate cyclase domain-containing protein n=1 Tax=unclassified Mycolicibacterium TaxID=2636767 RepID=UPI00192E45A2|nr:MULTISPECIES: adenylate/guanylate cyclase domain-containing protein [unclassified Mycolicibacterium]MUM05549.1 adenylate/guanylate cyclase domain-containing protein [Mycolicibacterium sp. CBMA 213]
MAIMDGARVAGGVTPPANAELVAAVRRSICVPTATVRQCLHPDADTLSPTVARSRRILTRTSRLGAVLSLFFTFQSLSTGPSAMWIGAVNLISAALFLLVPLLYRFGELVPPAAFVLIAYTSVTVVCIDVGTGSGILLYFAVAGAIALLIVGLEHLAFAGVVAAVGIITASVLEFTVPAHTGAQTEMESRVTFVITAISACLIVMATVWSVLRENAIAQRAIQAEYLRSETLLANILPESIAQRLKDPAHAVIADKFDDASVLFADIAGYTQRASDTAPADLVQFLDTLYTDLDALVDRHGLEKVKTSGDSYMVVSGVPHDRDDHLEALACLALDFADAVRELTDPKGRPVPIRIGIAAGPVVAGVVGSRKFFYDVWGDAVNVASRMESTDVAGRIQVPHNVYERLQHAYEFEERGEIEVKGKGPMRTWYLQGRRGTAGASRAEGAQSSPCSMA